MPSGSTKIAHALSLCLAAAVPLALPTVADARSHHGRVAHHHGRRLAADARHGGGAVIQCVAFARADSGVALAGNAADWWDNAAGVYARGNTPEIGSVLNFRPTERMRLGHVAVVTDTLDNRTVLIDQSHWESRGVSRDVRVVDVSADNDWSAVRVELGHQGTYGSIYPTYGFIYARPAGGHDVIVPAVARMPARHSITLEVAEAPDGLGVRRGNNSVDLSMPGLTEDAPDRSLR